MTENERLQEKKDALWEMHQADKTVACLERRTRKAREALECVAEALEKGTLRVQATHLVIDTSDIPSTVQPYPSYADLTEMVGQFEEAKTTRDRLKQEFARM